jgi:hypothetical protein
VRPKAIETRRIQQLQDAVPVRLARPVHATIPGGREAKHGTGDSSCKKNGPDQPQADEDGHAERPAPPLRPAILRRFAKLVDRISEPVEGVDLAAELQRLMAKPAQP